LIGRQSPTELNWKGMVKEITRIETPGNRRVGQDCSPNKQGLLCSASKSKFVRQQSRESIEPIARSKMAKRDVSITNNFNKCSGSNTTLHHI
jgi:hypothetical protein